MGGLQKWNLYDFDPDKLGLVQKGRDITLSLGGKKSLTRWTFSLFRKHQAIDIRGTGTSWRGTLEKTIVCTKQKGYKPVVRDGVAVDVNCCVHKALSWKKQAWTPDK